MNVTREIIIKLHTQITDAFLASKRPGWVELKRFEDLNQLYLGFYSCETGRSSKTIYQDKTDVDDALSITSRIINFLQGKRQTL